MGKHRCVFRATGQDMGLKPCVGLWLTLQLPRVSDPGYQVLKSHRRRKVPLWDYENICFVGLEGDVHFGTHDPS